MPGTPRLGRGDALALSTLLATSIVIALPILRGGYLAYIDNSVHLAEIYELARPDGLAWSEIGFAGFPLGTLHSPLWYPLLAALVRRGASLDVIYPALLVGSYLAPSLAIYAVARRRVGPLGSALLGYLLLVQPAAVWGIGSPLGGMWTHALSTAALILLADRYARPELTPGQHWSTAVLLALAVLTHLFVLPLVALIFVTSAAVLHGQRLLTRRELERRLLAGAVAAAASAKYWLTLLLVGNQSKAPLQALRPTELAYRLFLPSDAMYLIDGRAGESIRWDLHLTELVPILGLIGLGVLGFVKRRSAKDALAPIGFWFSIALLSLLVVHRYFTLAFLGPVSFRLIEGARVGFALSAIAFLGSPAVAQRRSLRAAASVPVAALTIASGYYWGTPLRTDCPTDVGRELEAIRTLARWLVANFQPEWGRIYIQDTFGHRWREGGMAHAHLPVLTSRYTRLPQLGTYYGVVPFPLRWTLSEFNSLYSMWEPTEEWILEATEKTNAGVLVTSNRDMADRVSKMASFEERTTIGRYSVFRRRDYVSHPIAELSPANHVGEVEWRTDEFLFPLTTDYPRARVLAKTAWHPWWHLDGVPGGFLRESPEGFLVIDEIPQGSFVVRLWFSPDTRPSTVTAAGWLGLSVWGLYLLYLRWRRPSPGEASA